MRALLQPVSAGLITAFVGYASSFAVILKGLTAVGRQRRRGGIRPDGAVDRHGARRHRAEPVDAHAGFGGVVDAGRARCSPRPARRRAVFPRRSALFWSVGALIVAAGLIRPFGRAVGGDSRRRSPMRCWPACCSSLCLAPVKAMAEAPRLAAPIILVWLAMARWKRLWATPAAAIVAALLIAATSRGAPARLARLSAASAMPVAPVFSLRR